MVLSQWLQRFQNLSETKAQLQRQDSWQGRFPDTPRHTNGLQHLHTIYTLTKTYGLLESLRPLQHFIHLSNTSSMCFICYYYTLIKEHNTSSPPDRLTDQKGTRKGSRTSNTPVRNPPTGTGTPHKHSLCRHIVCELESLTNSPNLNGSFW